MSASTVTGTPARPLVAQLMANAITQTSVASTGCRRRRPTWCLSYRRSMPTDTTKARRSAAARVPPAFSRDPKFEALAESCTRFLLGHGRRSADELLATIPRSTKKGYYGVGGAGTELEEEVASLLGKEAALFLPTGTMAQQATLRVHADRRSTRSVAFHPACHMETNEERGYQRLHGLFGVPVGPRDEQLSSASLNQVHEPIAALLLELPQRALGGTLPTWKELVAQVT